MVALLQSDDVRVQYSLISLLLRHPEFADVVPDMVNNLSLPWAETLQRDYTAAVYLQQMLFPKGLNAPHSRRARGVTHAVTFATATRPPISRARICAICSPFPCARKYSRASRASDPTAHCGNRSATRTISCATCSPSDQEITQRNANLFLVSRSLGTGRARLSPDLSGGR
jgi:hypothetical protein